MRLVGQGGGVKYTKNDVIFSENEILGEPPAAKINGSNVPGIELIPREIDAPKSNVGGRSHFQLKWRYEICPPLRNPGEFLNYSYSVPIPKEEAPAFTNNGSIFFFESEAAYTSVECLLIAPESHRIETIDYFVQEPDNSRIKITGAVAPKLSKNSQILSWQLGYRPCAKYIVKYRLVPN